jgi:hypothetical protein
MSLLFNFALVGLLAVIAWLMFRDSPCALLPIASITLVLVWQGTSIAYLESGAYSPELMLATYSTGATLRYAIAVGIFLLAYWFTFRSLMSPRWLAARKNAEQRLQRAERFAMPMIMACLLLIVVLLAYAPRATVDSRSKFLVENPIFLRDQILNYQPYFTLILGYATGITSRSRVRAFGYLILFLLLLTLFLYGNKFSGILESFFFFCMPFLALTKLRPMDRVVFGLTVRKQILVAVAGMAVLISAGLFRQLQYARQTGAESAGTAYLTERVFVLQGGIWWNTDNLAIHGLYKPGFREFLDFTRGENYYSDSSLMYLMTRAIGYDLTYKVFMIDDSLFTGTFPAIFYEIGGRLGPPVLCAFSGIFIAILAAYLTRKILSGQALLVVVAAGLFVPLSNIASAAEFTPLLSLGLLAKFCILVLLEINSFLESQVGALQTAPSLKE